MTDTVRIKTEELEGIAERRMPIGQGSDLGRFLRKGPTGIQYFDAQAGRWRTYNDVYNGVRHWREATPIDRIGDYADVPRELVEEEK